MSKFKVWVYSKFLPAWCKDDLLDKNRRLSDTVLELRQENLRLQQYINGMETAMRFQRRITINNSEVRQ